MGANEFECQELICKASLCLKPSTISHCSPRPEGGHADRTKPGLEESWLSPGPSGQGAGTFSSRTAFLGNPWRRGQEAPPKPRAAAAACHSLVFPPCGCVIIPASAGRGCPGYVNCRAPGRAISLLSISYPVIISIFILTDTMNESGKHKHSHLTRARSGIQRGHVTPKGPKVTSPSLGLPLERLCLPLTEPLCKVTGTPSSIRSFVHSFIHSFTPHLMSASQGPGAVQSIGNNASKRKRADTETRKSVG